MDRWKKWLGLAAAAGLLVALVVAVDGGSDSRGANETPLPFGGDTGRSAPARGAEPTFIAANHEAWGRRRDRVRVAPVPIDAEPAGAKVIVAAGVESCSRGRPPTIDRVDVVEGPGAVVLTAYVAYPPPYGPGYEGPCAEELLPLTEEVELARPLGKRGIYDGFRWPPAKRWP